MFDWSFYGDTNATAYYLPGSIGWSSPFDGLPAVQWTPGSLQVIISPPAARIAGAQWQVDGGTLQNSGVTVSNLSVGTHAVSFSTIDDWATPASQTVSVSANSFATAIGTYVPLEFDYTNTNGTITITGYTGPGGAVIIPSKISGLPVTGIGDGAFYNVFLTSVTIPDSVTGIGDYAFNYCASLTNVTIPASVTNIGQVPFYGCTSLPAIMVDPENMFYSSLNGVLFNQNETALFEFPCGFDGSYTIPAGVTTIESSAFADCGNLTGLTIPDSVTNIGDYAFNGCGLTNVIIPNSLINVGDNAFFGCSGLTSVTIPNTVTNIGVYAFLDCYSLTSVTIPGSVISVGDGAFEYCYDVTNATISMGVTSIESNAFVSCYSLGSVTIPGSVTNIGDYAFLDCYSLTNVTIPNSVTSIGNWAFSDAGLTSVTIPNSVTNIGSYAFAYSALTNVMIGTNVTSIEAGAFYDCAGLTSVTIPSSVTSIGDWAFADTSLEIAKFLGNAPTADSTVFYGDTTTACYLPGATGWGFAFGGVPAVMLNMPLYSGLVLNGGFETGELFGWTLSGDTSCTFVDDGFESGITPYSGDYAAAMGTTGSLGYLSQTLATVAGARYSLSFWLDSPYGETSNEFLVSWNGNTLFDEMNIPAIGWNNLQFLVSATATSTVLEFGFRDDPGYLGLDDISVVPAQAGIASLSLSGANLVLNGISGQAGTYYVLASTNLALPFSQWTPVATNVVSTNGNFVITVTNTVTRNVRQRFYILETQ
jgi:hypothetical protein